MMDIDTIDQGTKVIRNRARRVAAGVQQRMAEGCAEAATAIDRTQHAAAELGGQTYRRGELIARRAAKEAGARPWAAFMVGGVLLAGVSYYLLQSSRRH
ncbi:MAG: hypothetical protein WCC64_17370 [Aliidongia sp.]